MEPIKTLGLVIRVAAYREAHQMLTVLTQTHGKIAVSAPGVRSFKNKNHAVGSPYRYGEFVLKVTRDGRYSLMEFTPLAFFDNINKSLHTMQTGMFFLELCEKVAPEEEPMPELLRLTLNALHFLAKTDRDPDAVRLGYEIGVLRLSGVCADLTSCVKCGSREDLVRFRPALGGVTCIRCGGFVLDRAAHSLLLMTDTELQKPLFSFDVPKSTIAATLRYTEGMIHAQLCDDLKQLRSLHELFPVL